MKKRKNPATVGGTLTARARNKRRARNARCDDDDLLYENLVPIYLELMRDPVVLVQSGITYDRKHICRSLLHFPTKDPKPTLSIP